MACCLLSTSADSRDIAPISGVRSVRGTDGHLGALPASGTPTAPCPARGRLPRGARGNASVPEDHWAPDMNAACLGRAEALGLGLARKENVPVPPATVFTVRTVGGGGGATCPCGSVGPSRRLLLLCP